MKINENQWKSMKIIVEMNLKNTIFLSFNSSRRCSQLEQSPRVRMQLTSGLKQKKSLVRAVILNPLIGALTSSGDFL